MTRSRLQWLLRATSVLFIPLCLAPRPVTAQTRQALKLPMPGIETFHPITTTVALGSDAAPEAMPALKRAGFDVVIVIREDIEEGYDRQKSERAAKEAGLRFIAIPFTRTSPDPAAVRKFLEERIMAAYEEEVKRGGTPSASPADE